MKNIDTLRKITLGTEATEHITIKIGDEEEEFEIRPLTSGELSKLQSIEKKGFKMKIGVNPQGKRTSVNTNMSDVDINAGDFNQYQYEALYKAVAWGLSIDEDIPVEQIEQLPAGVPEQIFEGVIHISSFNDNDLTIIKQFRKEQ